MCDGGVRMARCLIDESCEMNPELKGAFRGLLAKGEEGPLPIA